MIQDNSDEYQSGAALLAAFGDTTREQKLARACIALMATLDDLHVQYEKQSLKENLNNENIFCVCSDAYRMGEEALK